MSPKVKDRDRKWIKATVEDQVDVRSYDVRTEDGRVYRRNRRHLRRRNEPFYPNAVLEPTASYQSEQSKLPENGAKEPPVQSCSKTSKATPPPSRSKPVPQHSSTEEIAADQESQAGTGTATVTRSGRVSRPPRYHKDFVKL